MLKDKQAVMGLIICEKGAKHMKPKTKQTKIRVSG